MDLHTIKKKLRVLFFVVLCGAMTGDEHVIRLMNFYSFMMRILKLELVEQHIFLTAMIFQFECVVYRQYGQADNHFPKTVI